MIDYFGYYRFGMYLSAAGFVCEDAYVALCLN